MLKLNLEKKLEYYELSKKRVEEHIIKKQGELF